MLRVLKLLMTSLGTPLPVSMVPRKLAELPIPLSFQNWTGKKQNMPVAWKVRLTSSTN